ncbi:diguanylate cyclase with PAS/PAC sensor [Alkalidesulfovibrio alkalitolerans DSM 16529]|uniref:diguanylate cyclase n=1 Tax=Alkalidesulfovibrio alkalitolerans DSM 16529 TaxID=1121439 RepID=S7UN22_9BACT|nr:HDOD domain-containing protein [Alkalidesulfovibrio alkalitolerans]EPR35379.1 diguanylate cyclase with PAS/PAC sensor [Alkalidesulfovibrio alkalitolerans DSM 16529]
MSDVIASLNECLKATFTPVTSRLIREVVKEQPEFEAIAETLGMDPALSAMVLSLVNSPYYGVSQRCTDLKRAAVVLGTQELLKLALTISFQKALMPKRPQKDANSELYVSWRVLVWAAIAAELICERLAPREATRAYLCAMFKDLSLMLLRCAWPERFEPRGEYCLLTERPDEEERVLGMPHGALTQLLLAQLNIPLELCDGIRHHHDIDRLDEHDPYCQSIILATRWSELEHGARPDPLALLHFELTLRTHLEMSDAEIETLRRRCVERFRSMLSTLGIGEAPPDERHYQNSLQEMQRAYFLAVEIQLADGGLKAVAVSIFRHLRLAFGLSDADIWLLAPEGETRSLFTFRDGMLVSAAHGLTLDKPVVWDLGGDIHRLLADGREIGGLRIARDAKPRADASGFALYLRFLSKAFDNYLGRKAVLERKALLLDQLPLGVAHADNRGRLLGCNARFREILAPIPAGKGTAVSDLLHEALGVGNEPGWMEFPASDRQTISRIFCATLPQGAVRHRCLYLSAHKVRTPREAEIVFLLEDVTEISELEMQALKELNFMEALVASMRDVVLTVDARGTVTFASPHLSEKIAGKNLFTISKPTGAYTGKWDASVLGHLHAPVEAMLMADDPNPLALELVFSPLGGEEARSHLVVGRDLTAVRRLEEKLKVQAMYDGLTGLLNHTQFQAVLERETQRAHRTARTMGLVFLDLDGFKAINDNDGHQAGDAILREMGHILRQGTRKGMDFPCRYGGDEFGVIFTEITPKQLAQLAGRLDKMVRDAFGGRVGFSGGVALLKPGETAASLLLRADRAAYKAKSEGGRRLALAD